MAEDENDPNFVDQAIFVNSLLRWNRRRLTKLMLNEDMAESFVEDIGLLPKSRDCPSCGIANSIAGRFGSFSCRKWSCPLRDKEVTRTKNTWFEGTRLKVHSIISLMYSYCRSESYDQAILEAADDAYLLNNNNSMSRETVANYYSFCREVIVNNWHKVMKERAPMGGPGCIVEIDESKFGRRKYNRGRRVHGHWVIGLIQRDTKELRMIICPWCPQERPDGWRDAEALLPLIQKNVAVGTTIHTDKWAAYNGLRALGYDHKVVNHSDPVNRFVAADGTHTNTIESSWRPAKVYFASKRISHEKFGHALVEYGWRKHCQRENEDPFDTFLHILRLYYHDKAEQADALDGAEAVEEPMEVA